jgi:hypothetical protein
MNQAELFALHPEYRHPKPPLAKLRLTPYEAPEADVLPSLLQALRFFKNVAWAERMNVGAGKLVFPDGTTSRFIRFGWKGCGDIIGQMVDGRFLSIEAKRKSGRSSDDQIAFAAMVNANGGLAFVARSIDDLRKHLA